MEHSAADVSVAARNAARDLKVLISRLRRQMKEVAATEELTASEASVLTRLALLGESSTSELAGAERIRTQSMSTILKALEEQGLIQRRAHPVDGRRQVITLTAAGRDRAAGTRATRDEWLAEALQERYTQAERTTITDALALLDRLVTP
jgi:DNA-binding MarR family transcriptional regulator